MGPSEANTAAAPGAIPRLVGAALDHLEEGLAVFDGDLCLVYCNAPFRDLRNYPESVCLRGAHISALYEHNARRGDYGSVDVDREVESRVARAASGESHELDHKLHDGTILHARYTPVPGGGLLFTYADVTENRQTAEALADSVRRNARIAEATTEGLYDWDISENRFLASPRLDDLFGFATGELTPEAWNWTQRIHKDDVPRYTKAIAASLKDDAIRYGCEYRILDKNGNYLWVLDRGVVSERRADGRANRFIGAILDITDRKKVEEALRKSEERFALAVDAVNEGIYDWNIDNEEIYYSDKVRKILGLSPDQLQVPTDWTDRIHPDDLPEYMGKLVDHFKGATERFECESRYRRGDGTWGWARQHGIAFRREDGRAYRMTGATGDISETKRLSGELETARNRLFDAIESVAEGFALFDADDRLVLTNGRYREIFAEAAGGDIDEFVLPGTTFETMIREGYSRGMFPAHPQGADAWVEQRMARHRDPDGPFVVLLDSGQWLQIDERKTRDGSTVGVYTDISEVKLREQEIEHQKSLLELTMENMAQGISLVDSDLNVVAFNSRFLELFDFPASQFQTGFPMAQAFRLNAERGEYGDGDIEQQVADRLALARQFQAHRFQRRRPDGVVLEIVGNPVSSGGFVTTYTDITERVNAEEAMRESEERYALAMAGANEGLWDWNLRTDEVYMSQRARALLDITHDEATVSVREIRAAIHPEDMDIYESSMRGHLREESDFFSCEFRCRPTRGETRWILLRGVGLRESNGRVYRMAGSAGDISDSKRREEELRAARDAAESALSELQTAQRSLVHAEKMASLGQLTAGIAHEIKNPLHFVNNFAGTSIELLDELAEAVEPARTHLGENALDEVDDLLETLKEDIDTIRQHGQRADGIVQGMLLHSRGDAGERIPTSLNDLLAESVNLAYHGQRASSPGFNVALEREFDPEVGDVTVVPQEMTRVFVNLLGNAFQAVSSKARHAGRDYRPCVTATSRALDEDRVEIRVRDNGVGVPSNVVDKLFMPFFSTKPAGEGTGLGLSISHDIIVDRHGGSIRAESVEGEYTELILVLPKRAKTEEKMSTPTSIST